MNAFIASFALQLSEMTTDQKVGQLFVAPIAPEHGKEHIKHLQSLLKTHHIGGVLLKQGTPSQAVSCFNEIDTGPIPLLCFADAEWGVSMRLKESVKYPRNLTLGAIQDLSLLEKFGRQVGKECRQLGIHINFAPVADVNTNPANPIIGIRSFGDSFGAVADKAWRVASGMQSEGVLACAKHFPGHGDTSVDSHVDLPAIDALHLSPFEHAGKNGIGCIMTAHLYYRPQEEIVTFSPRLVKGILIDKWKFDGLIITDALNMGALAKYYTPGESALGALKAGHDVLLFGSHLIDVVDQLIVEDIPQAVEAIKKAVAQGEISEEELDAHVLRILQAKDKLCNRPVPAPSDLRTEEALFLKKLLYREAMTLVSNDLLPLSENSSYALVQFGAEDKPFGKFLSRYGTIADLDSKTPVIVAIYDDAPKAQAFLEELQKKEILYAAVLFCSPYKLLELGVQPTTLVAYEDDPDAQEAAADVIFGKLEARGKLPMSLSQ